MATIEVEVVDARAGRPWCWKGVLPAGATVADALEASGLYTAAPELAGDLPGVGVFGEVCSLSRPLGNGDRVEVYRHLVCDPREARRRRAARERAAKSSSRPR